MHEKRTTSREESKMMIIMLLKKFALLLPLLTLLLPRRAGGAAGEAGGLAGARDHGTTCRDGFDAFCTCHKDVRARHPAMCRSILAQCRLSFCRPLCLRMAWKPTIRVRCDLVPEWGACREFKRQVERAEKAITAQFQAHVCSDLGLGCCGNETKLLNWVENHVYADLYPRGHLPIDMCAGPSPLGALPHRPGPSRAMPVQQAAGSDGGDSSSSSRGGGGGSPKKSRHEMCQLCEKVIEADIDTHEESVCLPPHGSLKKVIPNSLHERCLFMADMIGNMKERLAREFREEVCSCTGCCDGGCYYHTKSHEPWLHSLVNDVTTKLGL